MKLKIYKLTTFLFAFSFLIGCISPAKLTDRNKEFIPYIYDFKKYVDKGFMFLPIVYYGDFELLGTVIIELHPEVKHEPGRVSSRSGYKLIEYYEGSTVWTKFISEVSASELFEYVYKLSMELGGDAFVNYKLDLETDQSIANNPASAYNYIRISGWIIKRK